MASEFETAVNAALAEKSIAGGAAIVVDRNGKTLFSKAFGKISLDDNARPFTFDTVMWIASCTKLSTAISVLQCVEKGLLKLDEPIHNILPEWKDPQIITGFDDNDKPLLKPATKEITLRRLLTHSSGMIYAGIDPTITKLRGVQPFNTTVHKDHFNPLSYEPGEGWGYGPGSDWAGKMVEKVTNMTLEAYMSKNIWTPLGMDHTTFQPTARVDLLSQMTGRVARGSDGKLTKADDNTWPVKKEEDCGGGNGLYSTASDYIKVITSVLIDDGKLLSTKMREELFRPQLETPQAFDGAAKHPLFGGFFSPGYPRDESTGWDYALGGAVVKKNIPGYAAEGTLFWSGLPNSYWFVDRTNGVCGFYGSWLMPPGDAQTGQMYAALQRAAVKEAAKL